jgi:hypothetical protein
MKLSEEAIEFLKKENSDYIEIAKTLMGREQKEDVPNQQAIDFHQARLKMRIEIKDFLNELNKE